MKTVLLAFLLSGCVAKDQVRMDYLNSLKEDGQVKRMIVTDERFVVEMK